MSQARKTFETMRRVARATAALRVSRRELAQIALLKGAHQERIVPLLQDCPVKVLANGEALLHAGEACPALYLVLSGKLLMTDTSANVPETPIRPGDCIGELFLLQKVMAAASVTAVEPTRLLVIDRAAAWGLIRASHEIARNWLALIAERSHVSAVIAGSAVLATSHERYTTHDERTGLNNRRWLEAMLPRQMARSREGKTALGLLLVEIDRFTDYVGRCGPGAADHACRVVADALVKNVRPTDLVACYSTALFVVVLPESNATNACMVAERIRNAIGRAGALIPDKSASPPFTVSIGVAQLEPATDATTFLTAAEVALQAAKAAGGDRVGMQE